MRFLALAIIAAFPACAAAQPAPIQCPAQPDRVAVTTASPMWSAAWTTRPDLMNAVSTALLQALERAGFVPIAAQERTPCMPTVALTVTTTMPESFSFIITRYSEQVTVTATLTMPDGRMWQQTASAPAVWFMGSLPISPVGGVPFATSQTASEQEAATRAAGALADRLIHILRDTRTGRGLAAAEARGEREFLSGSLA